jgi:hypothetical protein
LSSLAFLVVEETLINRGYPNHHKVNSGFLFFPFFSKSSILKASGIQGLEYAL